MVEEFKGILVHSELNSWINFVVAVSDKDYSKAKEVISEAYDEWNTNDEISCYPIGEWVSHKLDIGKIEHDIFYAEDEEAE